MTCPQCQREIPADVTACPVCQARQTTGITDDYAAMTPTPVAAAEKEEKPLSDASAPPPEAIKPVPTFTPPTRDAWRPKKEKIRHWLDDSLNHYEVLELPQDASEAEVQAHIAVLDQTLERWSKDHDADLQHLGNKGKERLRSLKTDFLNRSHYNQQLAQQSRQKLMAELIEKYWWSVEESKILSLWVWRRLQESAAKVGLQRDEMEQIVQEFKARGVYTGLEIAGQEARSLDDLKRLCDGQGEPLMSALASDELARWLRLALNESALADQARKLKEERKNDLRLGAQLWLWEIDQRWVLSKEGRRWEVVSVEQWIALLYDSEREIAEGVWDISLRDLSNKRLYHWLRIIGHHDLFEKARSLSLAGARGLWQVVWQAEEKCQALSLQQRAQATAYQQTKKLVGEDPDFTDGHFQHAANCALRKKPDEMSGHLRQAFAGNPQWIAQARISPYFADYQPVVAEIAQWVQPEPMIPTPPDPPLTDVPVDKKAIKWWRLALATSLVVALVGWWYFPLPPGIAPAMEYVAAGQLKQHDGGIASLVFSNDGAKLISGGQQKWVNIWEVATRQLKQTLKIEGKAAGAIALTPDGKQLATGSPIAREVSLWGLQGGELQYKGNAEGVQGLGLLEYEENGKSRMLTAMPQKNKAGGSFTLSLGTLQALSFAPDGEWLAGSSEAGKVRLWRVRDAADVTPSADVLAPAAFSAHEKKWATGIRENNETFIALWDLTQQPLQLIAKLRVTSESLQALAFSPDGEWLASGCGENHFCLWKVDEAISKYRRNEGAEKITTTPNQKKEVVPGLAPVKLFALSFSPTTSGKTFLAVIGKPLDGNSRNKGTLWQWDGARLEQEKTVLEDDHNASITAIVFSPDAQWFAAACNNGIISMWRQQPKP